MDVVALLNASAPNAIARAGPLEIIPAPDDLAIISTTESTSSLSVSPVRRESEPSRATPATSELRGHTPWDAGGYSLPLTLDTKLLQNRGTIVYNGSPIDNVAIITYDDVSSADYPSQQGSSPASDMTQSTTNTPITRFQPPRRMDGEEVSQPAAIRPSYLSDGIPSVGSMSVPKSPKHKCSDSHSSFSSYTSSSQSGGHSRISSLSTTSGFHPIGATSDMASIEPSKSAIALGLDVSMDGRQAPQYTIDGDARAARAVPAITSASMSPRNSIVHAPRPGSPSDAILMRGSAAARRESAGSVASSPQMRFPAAASLAAANNTYSKSHKRAISAPDLAAASEPLQFHPLSNLSSFPRMASLAESGFAPKQVNHIPGAMAPPTSTSSSSNGLGDGAGANGERPPNMDGNYLRAPAEEAEENDGTEEEVKCMYVDNCDTGSQPRKAISHIFGRNKLCTRMIPRSIWVHFCRKHYQRSRYRNAHEYSKLQVDLVRKQIDRVQRWSDDNARHMRAGVVASWSLSVRKREQKRLEDRSGRKRLFQDSDDENELDNAELNGTAVPGWLLEKCGTGYDTPAIQEIVEHLRVDIENGTLSQIPDIEILPNINGDFSDKTQLKRKISMLSPQKRSMPTMTDFCPDISKHPTSPPSTYTSAADDDSSSPLEKRARLTTGSHPYDRYPPSSSSSSGAAPSRLGRPTRNSDRTVPMIHIMRPRMAVNSSTSYPPADDGYYRNGRWQNIGSMPPMAFGSFGSFGPPPPPPPPPPPLLLPQAAARLLPAPSSQPLMVKFEAAASMNPPYLDRRQGHQRSQSEATPIPGNYNSLHHQAKSGNTTASSYRYSENQQQQQSSNAMSPSYQPPPMQGRSYYKNVSPSYSYQFHSSNSPAGSSTHPSYGGMPVLNALQQQHSRHQSTPAPSTQLASHPSQVMSQPCPPLSAMQRGPPYERDQGGQIVHSGYESSFQQHLGLHSRSRSHNQSGQPYQDRS